MKKRLDERLVSGEISPDEYAQAVRELMTSGTDLISEANPPAPQSSSISPAIEHQAPFEITQSTFRTMVVVAGLTGVLGILVSFLYGKSLPPEIDEYLSANTGMQGPGFAAFGAVAFVVLLPAYLWSLYGMWKLRSSARRLLLIVTVVGYGLLPFCPASVVSGLEQLLGDIGAMATSSILTLAYWGKPKGWFA